MACRGSAAVLLVLLTSGCRFAMTELEVGTPWDAEDIARIEPEASGRADVLDAIGPPDSVRYTEREEILEYRTAYHKGTDFEFLLPSVLLQVTQIIGWARTAFDTMMPSMSEPEQFAETNFVFRIMSFVYGQLIAQNPLPLSGEDALALRGRALQYDVIRVTLDRATLRVSSIRYLGARRDAGVRDAVRRSLLRRATP